MPKLGLQIIHINLVPHTKFQLFFMSLRNIFGTTHFYDQMVFFTIRRHFCQRIFCIIFYGHGSCSAHSHLALFVSEGGQGPRGSSGALHSVFRSATVITPVEY